MPTKKVLVLGAHDDDPVIGVGGILRSLHVRDTLTLCVCTDGRNSHSAALDIQTNPTPDEVASRRQGELEESCLILGRQMNLDLKQLNYDDGSLRKYILDLEGEIESVLAQLSPDIVYIHALDAHPDHRAVHDATVTALKGRNFKGEVYAYSIWTQELAAGRLEVDASQIEPLTGESQHIKINEEQLYLKRRALFAFTSQVQTWPYPDWQPQAKAVLEKLFIDYFLRGEEIITPVQL